ncbi:hypothetical protein GmRootV512_54690 [Variovorax sp. V512]
MFDSPRLIERRGALRHLHARQVDPYRLGLRVTRRERNQVAAGGAAQLEHARLVRRRRLEPEQEGQGFQVLHGGLGKRVRVVGHRIVVTGERGSQRVRHERPLGIGRGCSSARRL